MIITGRIWSSSWFACRFLAREFGIAGRNSLEMAQVDEIVDAIQDAIEANVIHFLKQLMHLEV